MGADWYYGGTIHRNSPCANCGWREGYFSNSEWNLVPENVCSNACGQRLQKKRESGMAPLSDDFAHSRQRVLRLALTIMRNLYERRIG